MTALPYRPEIDGLRAVAVLPVMLFHAGISGFSGGFVGVDVFFVISGYLITSQIVNEMEKGEFSLARFYERRARRILPALFFVMAACIPFAWFWLLPRDLDEFAQSVISVALFSSNFYFWHTSNYFGTSADLIPLLHTWSLAVEEQYYLLFPLFMILSWRIGRPRVALSLAGLSVLSLGLAQWQSAYAPAAAFFLLPARAWELLIGALLALHWDFLSSRATGMLRQGLGGIGLALIIASIVLFDEHTPFPSLYALAPTVGAALCLLCARPGTWAGTLLSLRPLTAIGLISYSAYLWHQPVLAFARHRATSPMDDAQMLALVALSLVLAVLTWRLVETPFRRRIFSRRSQVFAWSAGASLVFLLVGGLGAKTQGFEAHYLANRLNRDDAPLYQLLKAHTGKDISLRMLDDKECRFWSPAVDAAFTSRFEACARTHGKAVVVLGDSHAMNIFNILAKTNLADFIVGIAKPSCRPHNNLPTCPYTAFDAFLEQHKGQVKTIVFHQSGSYLFTDKGGNGDSPAAFAPGAPFLLARGSVDKIADYLNRLAGEADVVWLGPFVEARVDLKSSPLLSRNLRFTEMSIPQFSKLEAELHRLANSEHWKFRYVSLFDILDIDSDFLLTGACITYNDFDHFSACGEDIVATRLKAAHRAGALPFLR